MLHLHRSNTSGALADVLCDLLAVPAAGPADEEVVVVPSPGMEAWLQQRIATRLGICANIRFPFPLRYVPELVSTVVAEPEERPALLERVRRWQPATLRWPIWSELRQHLSDPTFAPVAAYLDGAADPTDRERRLLQLATSLARAFDRYVRFRPELVRDWQSGATGTGNAAWQSELWRAVYARLGTGDGPGQHVADFEATLGFSLRLGGVRVDELPPRLFVFGVSTLPPLFVRLLAALADAIDVHLMVVTPSQEWMEGVVSTSLKLRRELEQLDAGHADKASLLHFEASPPLLGSFGALGAEFQQVLEQELEGTRVQDYSHYVDPLDELAGGTPPHLLAALQHELLTLTPRESMREDAPEPVGAITVEIHRAHNDLRQIQILQDRILLALEASPDLQPRDIVVMSPVLDELAPLIDAVFDLPVDDPRRLSYRIADRNERQGNPMAEALVRALSLVGGRLPRQAVFDVAGLDPVRRQLGWSWDSHEQAAGALASVGVRWGFDADHRAAHGHARDEAGTWRAGLDRLLLGAIVPDDPPRLFGGVRPTSVVEGKALGALASLTTWLEALREAEHSSVTDRTPADWRQWFAAFAADTLAPDPETPWHHTRILEVLETVFGPWADVAGDETIPFGVARDALVGALTDERAAHGFLRGGVTFCDMLPMRSVPFRVVALVGVDDGRFPRQDARGGIDLLETDRRLGDRSRRSDDRYLMLEALTSARDQLLIVHHGFAADTGERLPASPVVAELQDAIQRRFGEETVKRVCFEHPLHPFSRANFTRGTRTPSFANDHVAGAQALSGVVAPAAPWLHGAFPPPAPEPVELHELRAFYSSPHRAFHLAQIGTSLRRFAMTVEDGDTIALDKLSEHRLRELDVSMRAQVGDDASTLARLDAALPPGAVGDALFGPVDQAAAMTAMRYELERAGSRLRVHDLQMGRVVGRIQNITDAGVRLVVVPDWKDRRLPPIWAEHVAMCAAGAGRQTVIASADAVRRLTEPADAERELESLVAIYDEGRRGPRAGPPRPGAEYATLLGRGKKPEEAVIKAAGEWRKAAQFDADLARLLPELPEPASLDASATTFAQLADRVSVRALAHLDVEGDA